MVLISFDMSSGNNAILHEKINAGSASEIYDRSNLRNCVEM